jgi:hypothetical protein
MQVAVGTAQQVLLLLSDRITECQPPCRHRCVGARRTTTGCKGNRTACWHCVTLALQVLGVGIDSRHTQQHLTAWLATLPTCTRLLGSRRLHIVTLLASLLVRLLWAAVVRVLPANIAIGQLMASARASSLLGTVGNTARTPTASAATRASCTTAVAGPILGPTCACDVICDHRHDHRLKVPKVPHGTSLIQAMLARRPRLTSR